MTPKEFKNCDVETQEIILEELCKLYSIVIHYPTSIDDLIIFVQWQSIIGKFGKQLENLLDGIYPYKKLNKADTKEKLEEILKLSNEAMQMVHFWNRCIRIDLSVIQ